eukprot:RCo039711
MRCACNTSAKEKRRSLSGQNGTLVLRGTLRGSGSCRRDGSHVQREGVHPAHGKGQRRGHGGVPLQRIPVLEVVALQAVRGRRPPVRSVHESIPELVDRVVLGVDGDVHMILQLGVQVHLSVGVGPQGGGRGVEACVGANGAEAAAIPKKQVDVLPPPKHHRGFLARWRQQPRGVPVVHSSQRVRPRRVELLHTDPVVDPQQAALKAVVGDVCLGRGDAVVDEKREVPGGAVSRPSARGDHREGPGQGIRGGDHIHGMGEGREDPPGNHVHPQHPLVGGGVERDFGAVVDSRGTDGGRKDVQGDQGPVHEVWGAVQGDGVVAEEAAHGGLQDAASATPGADAEGNQFGAAGLAGVQRVRLAQQRARPVAHPSPVVQPVDLHHVAVVHIHPLPRGVEAGLRIGNDHCPHAPLQQAEREKEKHRDPHGTPTGGPAAFRCHSGMEKAKKKTPKDEKMIT